MIFPCLAIFYLFYGFVVCVDNSSKFWEVEVLLLCSAWIHLSLLDFVEKVENFVCWRVQSMVLLNSSVFVLL